MSEDKVMTLEDALNTVQIAIALGAKLPAPAGSHFFEASIHWSDPGKPSARVMNVGYFASKEAAISSIHNSIISAYAKDLIGPWVPSARANSPDIDWDTYAALRQEYLDSHSKEDLINYRFAAGKLVIKKIEIERFDTK